MPPPKRLIAQEPLPLAINRIPDRAIRKQLALRVIRVVALNRERVRVAVNLARLGEVNILHPLRVALERLGDADAFDAGLVGRAGLDAFDVVAEDG